MADDPALAFMEQIADLQASLKKVLAENVQLKLDMGTVKQAREMTDRAMASARAWEGQCVERMRERDAALLQLSELKKLYSLAQGHWDKDALILKNLEAVLRLPESKP
jgi:regulator of replication initiation timing